MFGTLGGPELFLILVLALIVFGPRKLPEIGKSLGQMMNEFRRASNEFRRTVEDEIEVDKAREQAEKARALPAPVPEPAAPPGTISSGSESAEAEPAVPPVAAADLPVGTPGSVESAAEAPSQPEPGPASTASH